MLFTRTKSVIIFLILFGPIISMGKTFLKRPQWITNPVPLGVASQRIDTKGATDMKVKHAFVCADNGMGEVMLFSDSGEKLWAYPAGATYDVWLLPNGNLVFTTGNGVKEVTFDNQVVFEYKSKGEVFSCQPIEDDRFLVSEAAYPRLIEIDRNGNIHKEIKVIGDSGHFSLRTARKTSYGTYLVGHIGANAVIEYGSDGKVLRKIPTPGPAYEAIEIGNGNLLISCKIAVIEVDPNGQIVWNLTHEDVPEVEPNWFAGIQRLSNGNTVVCNWLGGAHEGSGVPIFEVNRDKNVVWKFTDTQIADIENSGINKLPNFHWSNKASRVNRHL